MELHDLECSRVRGEHLLIGSGSAKGKKRVAPELAYSVAAVDYCALEFCQSWFMVRGHVDKVVVVLDMVQEKGG